MNNSVSVIITCYNLESFIAEAIQSVCLQNYRGDVEIIVVDDCSTDNSAERIKSFPLVKYVPTNKNLGVLGATLEGLKKSKGDYIFFLDGDDIWEPDKLSECVCLLNQNPSAAFITHDLRYIDFNGRPLNLKFSSEEIFKYNDDSCEIIRNGILFHSNYVWLGSAFGIRRSLVNLDDFIQWAEKLPDLNNTYQDWPLAFWIACIPRLDFVYINKKLFAYRLHGKNYSTYSSNRFEMLRNIKRALNTMNAIYDLSNRFNIIERARVITSIKRDYYNYLYILYSGSKVLSIKLFFELKGSFHVLSLNPKKEWLRFCGIIIFGVEFFIRIKNTKANLFKQN